MLLVVLNRMLPKIRSLVSNYNGRLERTSTQIREANRAQQKDSERGPEGSIRSMVSGSNEKKILPDPWYN